MRQFPPPVLWGASDLARQTFSALWVADRKEGLTSLFDTNHAWTKNAHVQGSVGALGRTARGDGSSSSSVKGFATPIGALPLSGEVNFSMAVVMTLHALPSSGVETFIVRKDDATNGQFSLAIFNDSGTMRVRGLLKTTSLEGWTTSVDQSTTFPDLNVPYMWVMRYFSGSLQVGFGKIGQRIQWMSAYNATGVLSVTGGSESNFYINVMGSQYTGGSTVTPDASIPLVGISTRWLSDVLADSLCKDPWQLLKSLPRRVIQATSGASGTDALSGSAVTAGTGTQTPGHAIAL